MDYSHGTDSFRPIRWPLSRRTVNGFRYCLDPLFLTVTALYLINRFAIKPNVPLSTTTFFAWYLNDLLCIPFCLPPVLYFYQRIGLRKPSRFPTAFEIIFHLVVWSVTFEWIAPRYFHRQFPTAVSDPWDVVCYTVGALISGAVWGSWRRAGSIPTKEART